MKKKYKAYAVDNIHLIKVSSKIEENSFFCSNYDNWSSKSYNTINIIDKIIN